MIQKLKDMLIEEREFAGDINKQRQDFRAKNKLKQENKKRVERGLEPVFAKKADLGKVLLEEKFEQLEKKGQTERFLEKRHEMIDRKRARR